MLVIQINLKKVLTHFFKCVIKEGKKKRGKKKKEKKIKKVVDTKLIKCYN